MNEPIRESAPKPPRRLPNHSQAWLTPGLAALIAVIMCRRGRKRRQTPPNSTVTPLPPGPDLAQLVQLFKDSPPNTAPQSAAIPQARPTLSNPPAGSHEAKEVTSPAAALQKSSDAAAGKTYILFEGTVLESVLINRLEGQFSGPIECLVTNAVYSHDRQHLLIPAGTKIVGETKKVEAFGQTRLAVMFHRLIMPDGYSASLDQFKGLNQIGDTG